MAYYRYPVSGGEFVLLGSRYWQLTFNGVQIGGLYRTPQDALEAIDALRGSPDVERLATTIKNEVGGPDIRGSGHGKTAESNSRHA